MFLGHFGLALAAKRVAPQTSFGTALLATEFADCLWPLFLTLGMEQVRIAPGITRMTPLDFVSYPWSHSLLMDCVWAAGFALLYFAMRRYRAGAWVVAAGVLSHWVLDWLSHRPDMPISPWSQQKYGLGLWNSVAGTVVVELGLFFGGLATYLMSTSQGRCWQVCIVELRHPHHLYLGWRGLRAAAALGQCSAGEWVCFMAGGGVGVLD
jgi:membrane-bound metal-dependent hydrolase YbcI (DUF457 family)